MREKSNDIWLKAATAGSLWASVEIVVGSFLHNLRVPFAGTILAVMGLSLMIAFQYKWKDRGLIWRAGLICAIMKSLSPSAVILGPMVGILTEAFLLDFFIRFLGRNPLGFIAGSVTAVLSALIHKVFTIVLLYGFNIVQILENMYQYAQKQLKITGPEPITLLIYLVILYFLFGILAATFGMLAGKKLEGQKQNINLNLSATGNKDLMIPGKNRYSLGFLFLHVVALIAGLYFINILSFYLSFLIILPYLIFVIIKYHKALRRFARPLFWIQLVIILLFAIVFWNEFSIGKFFDSEGLIIGLKMVFRAVIVIMVFSAISVELRNPIVKTVLYRKGFSRFYSSLSLAFSVLPGVTARLAKPGNIILRPVTSLSQTILYAEDIFMDFKEQMKKKQPVFIISGDQREGKTTFLKAVMGKLITKGILVEGIMAEGLDKAGERTGFQLVNVSNGKSIILCSIHPKPNWEKTGKYYFNPDGLKFGNKVLNKISADSIVIIDEIGPLEMKGSGWSDSVQKILENYDNTMIWVVRRSLTEQIIHKFELKNVFILDISKYTPEELVDWIPLENQK
jgi:nucleoside-triphosphatase THEP1